VPVFRTRSVRSAFQIQEPEHTVAKPTPEKEDPVKPSFEQALAEIESIVHDLEEGRLGLEEMLARYERGVKLLRECHGQLEQAERRIELLTGVTAECEPIVTPLDDTVLPLDEKARQRSRRRTAAASPDPQLKDDGDPKTT
jgi:exodeoxyribonuclease VII small subunit